MGSLTPTHVRAARCLIPERISPDRPNWITYTCECFWPISLARRASSQNSPTQSNLQVRLSLVISDPLTKFSQSKPFISSKRPALVTATATTRFVVYSSSLFGWSIWSATYAPAVGTLTLLRTDPKVCFSDNMHRTQIISNQERSVLIKMQYFLPKRIDISVDSYILSHTSGLVKELLRSS